MGWVHLRQPGRGGDALERPQFARDNDVLKLRHLGLHLGGKGGVVEALETLGDDQRAGAGTAGEVDQFGPPMRGQRIDGDQPGQEQAEDRGQEGRDVRKLHDHAIARPKAERQVSCGGGLGPRQEIGVAEVHLARRHRDAGGMLGGAGAQDIPEGLAAPVAPGAVAGCEILRPDLAGNVSRKVIHREPRARGASAGGGLFPATNLVNFPPALWTCAGIGGMVPSCMDNRRGFR